MLSAILSGSLCLVPQLTLSGRVAVPAAVPVAVRRLAVSPQAALTTDEKIVPRDVLFGNPEYASPMLSPDGKLLAYLRPAFDDKVLNVWCRTVGQTDDRVVTSDKYRGIRQAFWAEDSKTLLYMQDDAGDENFHLFAIDATSSSSIARDLTPYKGAKAQNVVTNKRFPDQLLVAINNRDPAKFDMYRCDLVRMPTVSLSYSRVEVSCTAVTWRASSSLPSHVSLAAGERRTDARH